MRYVTTQHASLTASSALPAPRHHSAVSCRSGLHSGAGSLTSSAGTTAYALSGPGYFYQQNACETRSRGSSMYSLLVTCSLFAWTLHTFFIHSSTMDVGLCPGLALMFKSASNMSVQALCGHYLSRLCGKCPRGGPLGELCFTFIRHCQFSKELSHVVLLQQCLRFQLFYILANTCSGVVAFHCAIDF